MFLPSQVAKLRQSLQKRSRHAPPAMDCDHTHQHIHNNSQTHTPGSTQVNMNVHTNLNNFRMYLVQLVHSSDINGTVKGIYKGCACLWAVIMS